MFFLLVLCKKRINKNYECDKQAKRNSVTEFMKLHPDFGRGRIQSKGESKKQLVSPIKFVLTIYVTSNI